MSPEHHHAAAEFNRAFAIGIALNTGQHAGAVDVRCLAWQFSTSLALVMFGADCRPDQRLGDNERAAAQEHNSRNHREPIVMNTSLIILIVLAVLGLVAALFVVGIYNTQRDVFPNSIITVTLHFCPAELFVIGTPEQREATKVSFA